MSKRSKKTRQAVRKLRRNRCLRLVMVWVRLRAGAGMGRGEKERGELEETKRQLKQKIDFEEEQVWAKGR